MKQKHTIELSRGGELKYIVDVNYIIDAKIKEAKRREHSFQFQAEKIDK